MYAALYKYIDHLEEADQYDWAASVYILLNEGFRVVKENWAAKKQRGQQESGGYLTGCTSLMTPWLYEKLTIFNCPSPSEHYLINRWCYTKRASTILVEKKVRLERLPANCIRKTATGGQDLPSQRQPPTNTEVFSELEHQKEISNLRKELYELRKEFDSYKVEKFCIFQDMSSHISDLSNYCDELKLELYATKRLGPLEGMQTSVKTILDDEPRRRNPHKHFIWEQQEGTQKDDQNIPYTPMETDDNVVELEKQTHDINEICDESAKARHFFEKLSEVGNEEEEEHFEELLIGSKAKASFKISDTVKGVKVDPRSTRNIKSEVTPTPAIDPAAIDHLCPQDQEFLCDIIKHYEPSTVLWEGYYVSIDCEDIRAVLRPGGFVSDTFIEAIQVMICGKLREDPTSRKVFIANVLVSYALLTSAKKYVKKFLWDMNTEISEAELITIPIHSPDHWHLLVIDLPKRQIFHYNSMGPRTLKGTSVNTQRPHGMYDKDARKLGENMKAFFLKLMGIPLKEWKFLHVRDCPQQPEESNNCGFYVMHWTELLSNGLDVQTTSHEEVHRKRGTCCLEILCHCKSKMTR